MEQSAVKLLSGLALFGLAAWGIWSLLPDAGDRSTEASAKPAPESTTPADPSETPPSGGPQPPTMVRIVQRQDASSENADEDRLIGEYAHAGDLSAAETDSYTQSLLELNRRLVEELSNHDGDRNDSATMLSDAKSAWNIELNRAAISALTEKSYVVTPDGGTPPPLNAPGAEVMQLGPVTLFMSLSRYPALANAREHRNQMSRFHQSELARKFNALPDAERAVLADRARAILAKPPGERTQDDYDYLKQTIGLRARLSGQQDLVIVRR